MLEFDIIHRYFKPLAQESAFSLGLRDDAALIPCEQGEHIVLSTDTLIVDKHFPQNAPPSLVARRCLRSALSDLTAMGARPIGYLMSLSLPPRTPAEWLQEFCDGLRTDQHYYGVHLLGGDLVTAPHDLSITMTVVGACRSDHAWKRSTVSDGDLLYVTGTIGDAYLGLQVLQGLFKDLDKAYLDYLLNRYYLPDLRFFKSPAVTAAIDISDGLLQDLGHLCLESHVTAYVQANEIPLSKAAQALLKSGEADLLDLLSGGDDYELILAVHPDMQDKIHDLSQSTDISFTPIGYCTKRFQESDQPVHLLDSSGQRIHAPKSGYTHEI